MGRKAKESLRTGLGKRSNLQEIQLAKDVVCLKMYNNFILLVSALTITQPMCNIGLNFKNIFLSFCLLVWVAALYCASMVCHSY